MVNLKKKGQFKIGNYVVLKPEKKQFLNNNHIGCLKADKVGRISTFNFKEKKYKVICEINNSLKENFYNEDILKLKPTLS